jgi:DNA-binding response OmpR family regulator
MIELTRTVPTRTVLVVEDDPAIRKLLSIVLDREGLDVVALEAVPEAFAWLEGHRPDLAVLDVNLPGGTGFEIVQRIQDRYGTDPTPPVVFVVSGLRQEHNVLHGLRLGVAEYLTKPFSPLELIARVRRHLPDPAPAMTPVLEPPSEPISNPTTDLEADLERVERLGLGIATSTKPETDDPPELIARNPT